jgi:uncharacterized membrane protein YtjA (UPF0391 family)
MQRLKLHPFSGANESNGFERERIGHASSKRTIRPPVYAEVTPRVFTAKIPPSPATGLAGGFAVQERCALASGTVPASLGLPEFTPLLMLKWALIFFVIALVAGALGFTTIAGTSIAIAKILFFIFLALVVIFVIAAIFVGKKIL